MFKAQKNLVIITFSLISGCGLKPFPYFDAAMNDHNRAPSSVALPKDENVKTITTDKVYNQSRIDYLFMISELSALEGQSIESVSKLEEVAELEPSSVVVLYRLAMENYRAGKNKIAIEWVEKALAINPNKKDINILAASLYSSGKQYAKAEKIYKKLILLDKTDPDAYLYLAAVYSEQKKYDLAIRNFDLLTRFPDYEQKHLAYYYGARTKFEKNRVHYFSQVKSDLKKCLIEKPDYLEAIQFLGQLIEKTEGKKKVFQFYADYQKKNGPIPRMAEVLSQYYLETADYDKAFEQLEIIESSTQDPIQVKLKMALILIDKKMYDKALIRLEELSVLVPESDKVKFYLGSLYQETNQNDKALKAYSQILESSKHFEDSVKNMAHLYRELNQSEKAIEPVKKLLALKPDLLLNHILLAQVFDDAKKYDESLTVLALAQVKFPKEAQIEYYLGTIYDKKNNKAQMFDHMYKAIALDANFALALNYVAYSLLEMKKDLSQAEALALKAYSIDKNDPYIIDTIGWIYFQKAEYSKAAEYLEKAHEAMPQAAVIAEHLGDVYIKLNQYNKAYDIYRKAMSLETDPDKLKQITIKLSEAKIEQASQRIPAAITARKLDPEAVSDLNKDESK